MTDEERFLYELERLTKDKEGYSSGKRSAQVARHLITLYNRIKELENIQGRIEQLEKNVQGDTNKGLDELAADINKLKSSFSKRSKELLVLARWVDKLNDRLTFLMGKLDEKI